MANQPFYKQRKFWNLIKIAVGLALSVYLIEVSGLRELIEPYLTW